MGHMARLPWILLVALALLPALPQASAAAEGDEQWSDRFGLPGIEGWVGCAAEFQGSLIIAGVFQGVGGVEAHNIAGWDGSRWSPLGDGLTGPVLSLAVYDGELVAVGDFQYSGTRSVRGIARWNGAEWSPLGTGLWSRQWEVDVNALAVSGGLLYAGGTFDHAGEVEARHIAQWNGSAWSALGGGLNTSAYSLLAVGGSLYAGGYFDSAGGAPARRSLARFHGELFLGGHQDLHRESQFWSPPGVYRWDGVRWNSFAVVAREAQPPGPSDPPMIFAMKVFGDRLVVAGVFDSIDGVAAKGIAAWDGRRWAAMDVGLEHAWVWALEECEGSLYAAGTAAGTSIAQWNGSRWDRLPSVVNSPDAFACANHALYAGGYWDPKYAARGVARWDGQDWAWLGSGTDGTVSSLIVHDNGLYVGGEFKYAGGKSSRAIGRWDLLGDRRRLDALLTAEAGVPNPFSVSTSFAYQISSPGHVRVGVFDIRGRRIAVLEDAQRGAGTRKVTWDGHVEGGGQAPAGIYFIRVEVPGRNETHRVVRLR